MSPVLANETPKKTELGMDRQTDRHTDKRTDGHCDFMTNPVQRAESVKIIIQYSSVIELCFWVVQKISAIQ